tara:strand:- start:881 stop:1129 length:249 start_codon:yes stop_codon:yes gene_type:complete
MPSPGASFLNAFIKDQQKEAGNEPGQLPSIQSAQSDAGQFYLEAAQPGAAQQGRYNPFEGQFIKLPDGRVVPRTPENSLGGP